uniref:Uncharacterized protein n=1 Tax=Glossina austeni TaxID=7395 RepID=A0A1A9UY10_GLOAU
MLARNIKAQQRVEQYGIKFDKLGWDGYEQVVHVVKICASVSSMDVNQLKQSRKIDDRKDVLLAGQKKCIDSCLKLQEAPANLNAVNITKEKTFRYKDSGYHICWTGDHQAQGNDDIVVIDCGGEDERTEAKAAIESSRANDHVVHTPTKLNHRFKIIDMSFKYDNDELIGKVRSQNPMLK